MSSTIRPSNGHVADHRLCSAMGSSGWPANLERDRPLVMGVLKGEGVGPEVLAVTLEVLDVLVAHTSLRVEMRTGGAIGHEAQRQTGKSLTNEVIDFCRAIFDEGGAVLCGPGGGRFVYELRTCFDLYCKLIPLRPWPALQDTGPLRSEQLAGVDIVVVRENTGGLYYGSWGTRTDSSTKTIAYQHCVYREDEVERILDIALRLARHRRGRLALITKPGGIPAISQLWEDKLHQMNGTDPVEARVLEIDNAVYQLIANPREFDVIVCSNMFGDVLGDCGGLLLGSRGMSYSGNFALTGSAVYQTGHGAAWDLAGTDRANPVGQICSLAMMLRETYGLPQSATAVEKAVQATLSEGVRTADIARPGQRVVGTRELGQHVCRALEKVLASENE